MRGNAPIHLMFALLLALAACSDDSGPQDTGPDLVKADAAMGAEGGPCYPNGTCNAGLTCDKGVCVKAQPDAGPDLPVGDGIPDKMVVDAPPGACQPGKDSDNDTIDDMQEGCLLKRDSDNDGGPDYLDPDSDNDGIPDVVEAGDSDPVTPPVDTDKDGYADYVDQDSDNDGLGDGLEDINGDGHVGCCRVKCNETIAGCAINAAGCSQGQTCAAGLCTPPAHLSCAKGESSPLLKDTFGLGSDKTLGNTICSPKSPQNPNGRKPIQKRSSLAGDWHVALEATAKYGDLNISGPKAKEAAAVIDEDATATEVAGFMLSMPLSAPGVTVQEAHSALMSAISSSPPGGGTGTVTAVGSGIQGKSHDSFDAVRSAYLTLKNYGSSTVAVIRNELVAVLLGRMVQQLGNLPAPYGSSHSDLVIRFTTVLRPDRVVVMGAVAGLSNYKDPARPTGFVVDDLSGGTGLAQASASVSDECDGNLIKDLPRADIIWVVDESGSMDAMLAEVVNNANDFFARALASGLDFRMGVTGVCDPNGQYKAAVGKFCSVAALDQQDMGGTDRFLLPSEQATFSACVKNPPGYEGGSEYGLVNSKEAVLKHLPRTQNAQDKIRPDAKLVIIVVTNEIPQSLSAIIGYNNTKTCTLPASIQSQVSQALQPYLDLFSGVTDPEAQAMYNVIGGVCNGASCPASGPADVAHGYRELAQALGGQVADICQASLGASLQLMIDSIVGAASPVQLSYVPITASMTATLDGVVIPRSRTSGFDYAAASNTLAFINVKYAKGSVVITSYSRWK